MQRMFWVWSFPARHQVNERYQDRNDLPVAVPAAVGRIGRLKGAAKSSIRHALAVSPKALTFISRTIRRWALHHRSDKSLQELAAMVQPVDSRLDQYDGNFYRTQLRSTLKRIDLYVIRWACR